MPDLNPFDDIADAAGDFGRGVSKRKKRLVKWVKGRGGVGKDAPVRGTGDRRPKQYSRGSRRTPFRKP